MGRFFFCLFFFGLRTGLWIFFRSSIRTASSCITLAETSFAVAKDASNRRRTSAELVSDTNTGPNKDLVRRNTALLPGAVNTAAATMSKSLQHKTPEFCDRAATSAWSFS